MHALGLAADGRVGGAVTESPDQRKVEPDPRVRRHVARVLRKDLSMLANREPQVRSARSPDATKAAGRDADDRHRFTVDEHRLPERAAVPAKRVVPVAI